MTDEVLHVLAREVAAITSDIDRKQLRMNEIVATARQFYASPEDGVCELVEACSRLSPLYARKRPMWEVLRSEYAWMIA